MLLSVKLGEAAAVRRINRFFTTVPYIFLVCLLALLCNVLSAERVIYTVFILTGVYICLLGEDLLGLLPLLVCSYLSPSPANNPGRNAQSVFSGAGGIYFLCLAGVLVVALTVRVIAERKRFFGKRLQLLPGILLLGLAYVLGGIGSPAYPTLAVKHILFALVQLAALLLPYWLFSGGVRWDKARRDYLAWTGFGVGILLVLEIFWSYVTGDVVVDGVIDRNRIYTGWGMYNNMGGMLAMMIPFAFYLASRYRRGWIGAVAGSVFLIGLLLTCSRSSVLCGCIIFALCSVLLMGTARNRRGNLLALVISVGVLLTLILLLRKPLLRLFAGLLSMITDPSHRDAFLREGLKQFVRYPLFGGSFYPIDFAPWGWSTVESFSSLFPPRWHNTPVQLLACCGIPGLAAYLYHRVQTTVMLCRDHSREKAFIGCAILVLQLTSLFDCHFFNIGPVLFYAAALAFAENCGGRGTVGMEKAHKGLATFTL